jgi:hypothetical protein
LIAQSIAYIPCEAVVWRDRGRQTDRQRQGGGECSVHAHSPGERERAAYRPERRIYGYRVWEGGR